MGIFASILGILGGLCAVVGILTAVGGIIPEIGAEFTALFWLALGAVLLLGCIAVIGLFRAEE
jgi:hypothetical protein